MLVLIVLGGPWLSGNRSAIEFAISRIRQRTAQPTVPPTAAVTSPITPRLRQKAPNQTKPEQAGLRENMTMLEVERLLGKPDATQTERGSIDAEYESPTVIKWFYTRYKMTDSDVDYGKPGCLFFIPERFTRFCEDTTAADSFARKYRVEAADSFRTYSYQGSFPTNKHNWDTLGSFGGLPLKSIRDKK